MEKLLRVVFSLLPVSIIKFSPISRIAWIVIAMFIARCTRRRRLLLCIQILLFVIFFPPSYFGIRKILFRSVWRKSSRKYGLKMERIFWHQSTRFCSCKKYLPTREQPAEQREKMIENEKVGTCVQIKKTKRIHLSKWFQMNKTDIWMSHICLDFHLLILSVLAWDFRSIYFL